MATYEGSGGKVMIKSGTDTLTAIAAVRSWSVSLTRDTVEDTSMASGGVRTFKKGLQSWSGSMEIIYDDTTGVVVQTALNPNTNTAVTVELYADAAGNDQFTGTIIVTEFGASVAFDGLMTATVSFQGTGACTATISR